LGARGNLHTHGALGRRHRHLGTEHGLPRGDFQFVNQIAAFHPEIRMLRKFHPQIQIARRPAAAGAALSGEPDFLSIAHTLRDAHFVTLRTRAAAAAKRNFLLSAVKRFLNRHQKVRLDVLATRFRLRKTAKPTTARAAPARSKKLLEKIAESRPAKTHSAIAKPAAGILLTRPTSLPVGTERVVFR
jgi:hypothetical protein